MATVLSGLREAAPHPNPRMHTEEAAAGLVFAWQVKPRLTRRISLEA